MAHKETELDKEVAALTANWVAVSKKEQPLEYNAWRGWRIREMRSFIEPDNFTVPTELPPTTVAGAQAYFDVVKKIRKCIGWRTQRSHLPKDPSAWMGELD
jgi:hypothetical protein